MITGALKNKIDKLWLEFHSGGITNPLTVVEQISYLMFARMLDIYEMRNEKKMLRLKQEGIKKIFPTNKQHLRWSKLVNLGAEDQLDLVQKELFPFFKDDFVKSTSLGKYFQEAQCLIQKPSLIKTAINTINELPLAVGDTKGDLYEYLLSKLTTAGVAGQFRTPRHIIAAMVEMLDVKPNELVCDPACGTGGFLLGAIEYLKKTYSSPELVHEEKDEDGNIIKDDHGNSCMVYPGDKLEPYRSHIENEMFHGFDFDSTMLRIAAMNMLLHGIDSPSIEYQDSLSDTFYDRFPQYYENAFDCILANPPFKGSIDEDSVHKSLTAVAKTTKTELLFVALMLRMLKTGGRCAVIVPDGLLFGSSNAHLAIRKKLIDENQLEAVISLPSGVFKPYAGVSTAILVFVKGGKTNKVWFYDIKSDGYSLDDKRDPIHDSDLSDMVKEWKVRYKNKNDDRKIKHFFVPLGEIVEKGYDLSLKLYKEIVYELQRFDKPEKILERIDHAEQEIIRDIKELKGLLK